MIAMLKGHLETVVGNTVILDVQGIGYQLEVTGAALQSLGTKGSSTVLHTFLHIKEDGLALYGFASAEEKELFRQIINVSGAGPKTALAILSALTPNQFIRAIHTGDRAALTKISGVGRKTAERLILELSDKLQPEEIDWDSSEAIPLTPEGIGRDAVEALIALGYSGAEAEQMVEFASDQVGETQDLQELLKAALGFRRKRGKDTWKKNA